jgi:hypothetical protein
MATCIEVNQGCLASCHMCILLFRASPQSANLTSCADILNVPERMKRKMCFLPQHPHPRNVLAAASAVSPSISGQDDGRRTLGVGAGSTFWVPTMSRRGLHARTMSSALQLAALGGSEIYPTRTMRLNWHGMAMCGAFLLARPLALPTEPEHRVAVG